MTDKQRAAIQRHGEQLLAIFPDATERDPVKLCKKLRWIEAAAHRHTERMCSDASYYNLHVDADPPHEDRYTIKVRQLLGSDRPWINNDPRGYALKVDLREGRPCSKCGVIIPCPKSLAGITCDRAGCDGLPQSGTIERERLYTDWGGYGIIAPEIGPEGL